MASKGRGWWRWGGHRTTWRGPSRWVGWRQATRRVAWSSHTRGVGVPEDRAGSLGGGELHDGGDEGEVGEEDEGGA